MIEIPFLIKFSSIIFLAFIFSFIFYLIKQPFIIAYIVTGLIASNFFIQSVETKNIIAIFSEFGIAFMLFIVGLNLKFKIIKEIGKQSLVIGVLQVIFTTIIGIFIALWLGFNFIESLYLGIALSFSSTIIMIKLISDKGDLEKLYGKFAIGFLIVQDLITILLLIFLPFLKINQNSINSNNLTFSIFLIIFLPLLVFYILPKLEKYIARSKEILFIFSISFLLTLASIFKFLGIGLEVGALIAGMSLANLSTSSEINSRLKPLKEFFLIIFFIYLGFNIFIPTIEKYFNEAIIFAIFVLIGNPLIMFLILKFLKIKNKTSFLLSLSSAQISEFSFIIIGLGNKLNHIQNDLISLVSLVGMITIFSSTYLFYYSEKIYQLIFKKILKIKENYDLDNEAKNENLEILLIGCDRTGYSLLVNFEEFKDKILIIDYNYEKFNELKNKGYKVVYGDVSEIELIENLNIQRFKMIISTILEFKINLSILINYKKLNNSGIFICNSNNFQNTLELYQNGADYVNMYHFMGGEKISELIKNFRFSVDKYEEIKKEDFEKIKNILTYLHKTSN
ncbi:MAG: cation:proton antiporter [Patescibacteria group bacterium]|nr:cation:proton antiporter [Patescibacteria group bacterium]